jgi:hypothetical protein
MERHRLREGSMTDSFDQADMLALGGPDRFFALTLLHSDHSDEEIERALERGGDPAAYPRGSVLRIHAEQSGRLDWSRTVALVLAARRRTSGPATRSGGPRASWRRTFLG